MQALSLIDGVISPACLRLLQGVERDGLVAKMRCQGISESRCNLLFEIIAGERVVDFWLRADIHRYALKLAFPEVYSEQSLGHHLYSTSELYEYDPPKNGLNAIKHGLTFGETVSYSSKFGSLLVPCPDAGDGTRCVIFSDLDSGPSGDRLAIPMPGMVGKLYTISIAQQASQKFRFISSRVLSPKSYRKAMKGAFKNIYLDDPAAKANFVDHCVDVVERQLFD